MATLSAAQRNELASELMTRLLAESPDQPVFAAPFNPSDIDTLFSTPIWGHREVVLTIIIARLINSQFKATEDFYSCHPRTLFEIPIRHSLRENGIPHRKSGPLNVAKNIKKIDLDWAADKNEERVAISVVSVVNAIETVDKNDLWDFALNYLSRYKQEAVRIKDLDIVLPPQENPVFIHDLTKDMIDDVPDGGATAQFIIGRLMEECRLTRKSEVKVDGYLDSVSTTNTTSKKPGDIIEFLPNEDMIVYETTTKAFSDDRLIESYESVVSYGDEKINSVMVICRVQDVPPSLDKSSSSYLMAATQYKQLAYYFVNIYEFIQATLLSLGREGVIKFYANLVNYVNEVSRSEKVKVYFKDWHSKRGL